MKKHYILSVVLVLFLSLTAAATTASAQDNKTTREAQDQHRLHKADSLSKAQDYREKRTKDRLKKQERELKAAQDEYDMTKEQHKQAKAAAKEAKKSKRLEKKAIKAREKAEKQAAASTD